ncbi:Intracellular growth attenuator protein igaA [Raoultella terrigena]|uniref:Intracellular growth attenuator protein igaA n=1 Tax=Raoultella terrigena TaxID=577 RepID=A0A4U9D8R2_RAOTE|nr:Intracellular growth attenuator protein igaA [Raoultella terrigena]
MPTARSISICTAFPIAQGCGAISAQRCWLLAMLGCMSWHGVLAIRRYQRHRQRMEEIEKYYESCLNPVLISSPEHHE